MKEPSKKSGGLMGGFLTPSDGEEKTAVDNTASIDCPIHHKPLTIQTEKRTVEDTEKPGKTKVIDVQFAVCSCQVPANKQFGRRVWEKS